MMRSCRSEQEVRVQVRECQGPTGLFWAVIVSQISVESVDLRSIQIPAPADAPSWDRERRQAYIASQLQTRGIIE